MEKIPRQRQHPWIQLTILVFVLVCAVIQCLCFVPFIRWNRTFAKWSLRYDAAGDSGRWDIEELRLHFGERVASSVEKRTKPRRIFVSGFRLW
ncbi:hypothetical protein PsorP6_010546 [Peronosclerospora sorghi]|uniref:Uncharacterized protein n=1 Tax=Peronosclerospora sorghi TaxID=230839 RepID=A0ACC0VYU4_9STRA|nr:hypothetical protein PsorP6_010546 [Peronosclerospora sorghi]